MKHKDTVGDVEERMRVSGCASKHPPFPLPRSLRVCAVVVAHPPPVCAQQWLADHPGEVEVPEGRVLQLQQDGKALPATAALLDLPQGRETPLEVSFVAKGGEEGKEEPADGEGDE